MKKQHLEKTPDSTQPEVAGGKTSTAASMASSSFVKERPIILYPHEVRGVASGRQSQIRRVMQSQPYTRQVEGFGYLTKAGGFVSLQSPHCLAECPYGVPGDRLWVRETWSLWRQPDWAATGAGCPYCVFPDGGQTFSFFPLDSPHHYSPPLPEYDKGAFGECKWSSPIHMPRWASRITLELTKVRVERVQDISEADAIAEGCTAKIVTAEDVHNFQISDASPFLKQLSKALGPGTFTAYGEFQRLWNSINLKRGYGWDANPWVRVLEFTKLDAATRVGEFLRAPSFSPEKSPDE